VAATSKMMDGSATEADNLVSAARWQTLTNPENLERAGITDADMAATGQAARESALQAVGGDTHFVHLPKITEFYQGMGLAKLAAERQGALREMQQSSINYVTRRNEFLGS
jgi:hypothetical protein